MSYEIFRRPLKARGQAKISILRNGSFWLSGAALKLFGDHQRTMLLFDQKTRTVAFKPTDGLEDCFSISRSRGRNEATVSGTAFLKHYKLISNESRSYLATWDEQEKIVKIDLDSPL